MGKRSTPRTTEEWHRLEKAVKYLPTMWERFYERLEGMLEFARQLELELNQVTKKLQSLTTPPPSAVDKRDADALIQVLQNHVIDAPVHFKSTNDLMVVSRAIATYNRKYREEKQ